MAQTYLTGTRPAVHRIDIPCQQAGFSCPPFDVQIKFLAPVHPLTQWTLLAHTAAGKPAQVASWLAEHPGIDDIRIGPGLAPKLLRATMAELPPLWTQAAAFAKVHHLDLGADGYASWFIEGVRSQVLAFVQRLEANADVPLAATEVRVRPVNESQCKAPISRRQFDALSTAVAMGYYDIPHRLDLRALAAQSGISLGSLSELLRRAEAAILTHYVDSSLMSWPAAGDEPPNPFLPVQNLLRPAIARPARPPSTTAREDGGTPRQGARPGGMRHSTAPPMART